MSTDPRRQFVEALRAHGLVLLHGNLIADGCIHACDVASKGARGIGDGRYLLYDHGSWAAGGFQNWTDGAGWQKWRYQKPGWQPSADEQRDIEQEQKRSEDEVNQLHAEARKNARGMWNSAKKPVGHPYAKKKKLKPEGLRVYRFKNGDRVLLVPVYDEDEKIQSLQIIRDDGSRKFLGGSRVKGGHFWVAHPDEVDNDIICIAEGWATGESIYQAIGHATLIAFSTNNLRTVATWARQQYPNAKIILCADDDHTTQGNPGLTAAHEAARAVNGLVAKPDFDSEAAS
jgi:putative DNA primase/helicase